MSSPAASPTTTARSSLHTLDDHAVAIDANTGKELWHTKLGDINMGETITMAPVVVKGKVLIGNSGGEMGVRGWLTALDENTGTIVWRAYSTGPDDEVLIGDDFKPLYDWMKGKDLGVKTWPPDKWKIGGGTVWGWISYDPDLNLIYYGTANPGHVEPRSAARRQSLVLDASSPAIPTPGRQSGPIRWVRTTCGTTTRSTRTFCRSRHQQSDCARSWSIPGATDSCT